MLAAEAALLNIPVVILDSGNHGPAKQIIAPLKPEHAHVDGSFADATKIRELATKVDVLTVEIEHVDADVLQEISDTSTKVQVHPSARTIRTIQDKFAQKEHLKAAGIPLGVYIPIEGGEHGITAAVHQLGLPLMLKSRTLAYDGRGNFVLHSAEGVSEALKVLGNRSLYAEKWVPFVKEVAVMVVRSVTGEVFSYPAVETVHKDNICHLVFAPLRSRDSNIEARARQVAEDAVRTFDGAGVFGVEMFLLDDGAFLQFTLLSRLISPLNFRFSLRE
jgi:phosphoribosylaminoimidazole carboxylase